MDKAGQEGAKECAGSWDQPVTKRGNSMLSLLVLSRFSPVPTVSNMTCFGDDTKGAVYRETASKQKTGCCSSIRSLYY